MSGPENEALSTDPQERRARRHSNDKPDDNRSPFERDRDRILYTSAFRRLAGVTQVVSALEGHVYHNRLTHTLKVAQVSRRLAEMLRRSAEEGTYGADLPVPALDADVAEAAAFAHDLGHPPFGHVAEVELQACMKPHDDANSFEGNAQSFRIVTKTALMDREFVGLNLTRATLDAILKYPWLRDVADERAKAKWGAYTAEEDDFRFARRLDVEPRPALPARAESEQCLEAAIMDWADDITYAVHDAEDHYRAGLVPLERLIEGEPEMIDFLDWVESRWQSRRSDPTTRKEIDDAASVIPLLFGSDRHYEGTKDQRVALRAFTSALIARYVGATSLTHEDGKGWILVVEPWARREVNVLKELAWKYVIERPALAAQQHGQRAIIRSTFATFMEAADSTHKGTSASLLPIRTLHMIEQSRALGNDNPAFRGRVVCDAICAMTEDEIVRLHSRLTGHSMGSVLDAIV